MIVRRATLATLPTLGWPAALVLLAVTIGTNLLDFASVPAQGARPEATFVTAAIVRVVLVVWAGYVTQRRLAGAPQPFVTGAAFWRFTALQTGLFVGFGLTARFAIVAAGPAPLLATTWLASFLGLAVWSFATIRTLAWIAALAAGEPFAVLRPLWRAQGNMDGELIGTFAALVLPLAALHLALTLIGLKVPLAPEPRLALIVVDGAVQAAQVALAAALAAVAWRIARSVEATRRTG